MATVKTLQELLQEQTQELQEQHDREGHVWTCYTTPRSNQKHFLCALSSCRATKTEPLEEPDFDRFKIHADEEENDLDLK